VNNKYPNTPLFRRLFENFRTRKIYYSYDEFGRLFDRSGPWAMYFEKGRMITKNKNGDKIEKPKSVYVSFEFIRNFFIAEYNDYLFHKKLPIMKKMLNDKIADKIIKPGVTIQKLFNRTDVDGRIHTVPPMSIFNPEGYAKEYEEIHAEEHEKKQMCYIKKLILFF